MVIRQIRLKNIKSFGEGNGGTGVVVRLDRGLNRIGGKNGAGKSSIIEAIGYALFDAEPIRGDNRVQVGTYLARDGQRTGEIDLWIETGGETYRIERDAGRMERRWKVIREADGYSEAEGNDEVKRFLARLFGVAGPERLSELFHSLIGVKQGRFTSYFDCKASEAKAHFDPLLDVDIFRTCFENLLEPLKVLQKQQVELHTAISGYQGGIDQLKDAPEQVAQGEMILAKARFDSETITHGVEQFRVKMDTHEKARQRMVTTQQTYIAAQGTWQHALTIRANAAKEVTESESAAEVLETALPGFEAYRAAEEEYKAAEQQRTKRDQFQNEEAALQLNLKGLNTEKNQRREIVETLHKDVESRQNEGCNRRALAQERNAAYQCLAAEVDAQNQQYQTTGLAVDLLKEWRVTLTDQKRRFDTEQDVLLRQTAEATRIDAKAVEHEEAEYERAAKAESAAQIALARAKQEEEQLARQLESIRGGVCPLLGEHCRQFSPERIQDQLSTLTVKMGTLETAWQEAVVFHNSAKERLEAARTEQNRLSQIYHGIQLSEQALRECCRGMENRDARQAAEMLDQIWPGFALPQAPLPKETAGKADWQELQVQIACLWETVQSDFELWNREYTKLGLNRQANLDRKAAENAWLVQETASLKQLGNEIIKLQERIQNETARITDLDRTIDSLNQQLAEVHSGLESFTGLDAKLLDLRQQLDDNLSHYMLYLQNAPLAAKLAGRQQILAQADLTVNRAEQDQAAAELEWQEACRVFDEAVYLNDNAQYQQALKNQGQARGEVERAELEVNRQKVRVAQLVDLESKRRKTLNELDRLNAQSILLDKARSVLKNAQGLVAAGLTGRIGARAQAIYNAMSPEPAQFEWDAGDYKLTVKNAGGERRFTQLSGGQQMKAAIAMQLALVKEFSKTGFCAFDEPTYGLDVESRQLLSEAIANVYRECNFDQLLVVSHDETFDDKVEHVVDLKYSGTKGTLTVES